MPEMLSPLCDLGILVDQATEPVPPQDPDILAHSGRRLTPGGRALAQRSVRAVNVVVLDIFTQDQPQVPLAGEQHSVQALAAGAGNLPLCDRVRTWRADRCLEDPHTSRSENRVERGGELGVQVPDQKRQPGLRGSSAGCGPAGSPTRLWDGRCGSRRASAARTARSAQDSLGVLTWRWSTAT